MTRTVTISYRRIVKGVDEELPQVIWETMAPVDITKPGNITTIVDEMGLYMKLEFS